MSLTLSKMQVAINGHLAVAGIDTEIAAGEFVGLVGPNGAGKSSFVKAVAGLTPATGAVKFDSVDLRTASPLLLSKTISYLAQINSIAWSVSVRELVALGRLPYGAASKLTDPIHARAVDTAMAKTSIGKLADRAVDTLSGGELSRALLARALAVEAPILLVDEPIAQLDPYHQLQIMETLRTEARNGVLVIAVLHDLTLAARFCDRLLMLNAGQLEADGTPEHVLTTEHLRRVYRVECIIDKHNDHALVVPWSRIV